MPSAAWPAPRRQNTHAIIAYLEYTRRLLRGPHLAGRILTRSSPTWSILAVCCVVRTSPAEYSRYHRLPGVYSPSAAWSAPRRSIAVETPWPVSSEYGDCLYVPIHGISLQHTCTHCAERAACATRLLSHGCANTQPAAALPRTHAPPAHAQTVNRAARDHALSTAPSISFRHRGPQAGG